MGKILDYYLSLILSIAVSVLLFHWDMFNYVKYMTKI